MGEGEPKKQAPRWVILSLQLAVALAGVLGAFVGGEHRGQEAALPAALEVARRVVSDKIENVTFRALEAEAEVALRVPPSVTVHLAQTIADLERQLGFAQQELAACQQEE